MQNLSLVSRFPHQLLFSLAVCTAVGASGCTGAITDSTDTSGNSDPGVGGAGSPSNPGDPSNPSNPGAGGGGGSNPSVDPPVTCTGPEVITGVAVPMRRLTRSHVERTISDVLGVAASLSAVSDEHISTYRSNISVSVDDSAAQVYLDVAERAVDQVSYTPCTASGCLVWLLDNVGKRLFRRPLEGDQRTRYTTLYNTGVAKEGSPTGGAKWVLQAMLQSPSFLYLDEPMNAQGYLDGYAMASRLALIIWGRNPDAPMLDAAARGDFNTPDGIRMAVKSMLADARSEAGLGEFVSQWLDTERISQSDTRPDLTALGQPTLQAIEAEPGQVFRRIATGNGTFADLFTTRDTVSQPLVAALYAGDIVSKNNGGAQLDPAKRSGLLTMPGVMASLAHAGATSPTLRGKAVMTNLLCAPPPPPPAGVLANLPPPTPTVTTRQRLEAHFSQPACASCHRSMDGIGFAFEHFDALGRWRDLDGGQPVDDTSDFDLGQDHYNLKGAVALSQTLSTLADARTCFASQWSSYAGGMADKGDLPCFLADLSQRLGKAGGLQDMMIELAASDYLRKGVAQ